jgi:hydroxyacylglutathione hydrolase
VTIIPIAALSDNYIWALLGSANDVWVVDPGEVEPVEVFLEKNGRHLRGILITHHHWDHTHGAGALKQKWDVPVFGPCGSPCVDITHAMKDGETLVLDEMSFTVMSIPGHTLDHIAYYANGILFCGDTLFAAGCGKVFEGSMAQMYASLQRLGNLPAQTKIYCGHEYTLANLTFAGLVEPNNSEIKNRLAQVKILRDAHLPTLPATLKDELQTNPFLRCEQPTVRTQVEQKIGQALSQPVAVFEALRNWKSSI